jgi:enamine deaminase RidA (YjgF/YER057c/UK114 family)
MSEATPERWNPRAVAAPIGKYSHLTRVPAGSELLFIAGQVGNDATGAIPDDSYRQTLQVLGNVEALLDSAGLAPKNLIRLLSFVAGADALPGYYQARDEVYARWFPAADYPGHSLAVVAALAQPALFVELEGWAAIPAR